MDGTQKGPRMAGQPAKQRLGRPNCTSVGAFDHADARTQFLDAMCSAGVVPTDPAAIIGDGLLHRFDVEGDKRGRRNGWAVLHLDGIPAGAFGTWRGETSGTWRAGSGRLTPAERHRINIEAEHAKRQHRIEVEAGYRQAQAHAQELWARAGMPLRHEYLVRKRVEAHGIRQLSNLLIVPMCDGSGELWSVQSIAPDGTKRFLAGSRKRGLFHLIGHVETELLIAEGYATAASLYEATGKPVAVAFDCGNLLPVAKVLRAKFPMVRITLTADNDTGTSGNPGLTKATTAARAIGGLVAIPPAPFNDFNDAAQREQL